MTGKSTKGNKITPVESIDWCDCCGKHLDKLKPFNKSGHRLLGEFGDALLIRRMRPYALPDKEADDLFEKFEQIRNTGANVEKAWDKLIQKYDEINVKQLQLIHQASVTFHLRWECRDCAFLDDEGYFEKLGYDLDKYREWKPRRKVEMGSGE
jgi:hypothetical protein